MLTLCTMLALGSTPNILLIVADDLGFNDVDFQPENRSVALTPNLRRLADEGVRFTNHHVQPFCSPTRAALMTGRHVLRYGLSNTVIWPQDAWALPRNETFLSEILKAHGYRTAQFGKWHLGLYKQTALPLARGFDEQLGYYLGGEDYYDHSRNGGLDWHRNDTLCASDNGTYSSVILGGAAAEFITRNAGTPWFVYLPFQSVHSPLEAPVDALARYPHLNGNVRTRAAMVSALDDAVGRVTSALEVTAQLERTVIVFTSDNGAPYGGAFDMGDDPAMIKAMGFDIPVPPGKKTRPPAPNAGPMGLNGDGGGSNWPYTGCVCILGPRQPILMHKCRCAHDFRLLSMEITR